MTSTIKVNKIEKSDGSTLTLGGPSTAVTLACGATQTGFGRTGTVDWCTTAKTSPFTSVSGNGYFVNTTGGAVTVTLPASPNAGDIVAFSDYASTFACNALTICRNSSKINGGCFNGSVSTEGAAITLVYVDGTRGWKQVNDATLNVSGVPTFISATGGTVTTSGDYKIHTFTGSSNFVVCTAPTPANNKVSYVVVAGGGASGQDQSGGGGAGGYREGKHSTDPYTASPLAATPCSALTIAASTTYPITIGAGGAGAPYPSTTAPGSDSVFSSITSAGGGGGGSQGPAPLKPGQAGGSGGGGAEATPGFAGGAGNTPPVSPSQGNAGGAGSNTNYGGGGGGAGEAGNTDGGGYGGDGVTSSINATPTARAGGGGSGATPNTPAGLPGGDGGGGTGAYPSASQGPITNGAANTGGGAGASTGYQAGYADGNNGGSGVVIIRYKFQ